MPGKQNHYPLALYHYCYYSSAVKFVAWDCLVQKNKQKEENCELDLEWYNSVESDENQFNITLSDP